MALEVNKRRVKVQYDKSVHPRAFREGDLVLLLYQPKEPLGAGKFNPMWCGPYVVKHVLENGAYELVDYEGTTLQRLEMGSISRNTMHNIYPRLLVVYYCTALLG